MTTVPTISHRVLVAFGRTMLGAVAGCLVASTVFAQAAAPGTPAAPAVAPAPAKPAIDPDLLRRASDFAYRQETARLRSEGRIDAGTSYAAYAHRLAVPLLATAGKAPYDLREGSWTITIEKSPELTLWSLPGGNIVMSAAFFQDGKFSAGELAALIAHLYAHEVAGHDRAEAAARFAANPDGASPDPNRQLLVLADILLGIAKRDPFEKGHERQADAIALDLLARSGYDPRSLVTMMKKLAVSPPAPLPGGFAAMHPAWPERVAEVEAGLDAAIAAYDRRKAELAAKPSTPDKASATKARQAAREQQRGRQKPPLPPGLTAPTGTNAPSGSRAMPSNRPSARSPGTTPPAAPEAAPPAAPQPAPPTGPESTPAAPPS